MHLKDIIEYKDTFLKYNESRKRTFLELSPKDADIILFLVPWLLSVNHPTCPGYVRGLKTPIQVANIHRTEGILRREGVYKRLFGIREEGSLLKFCPQAHAIQGVYTIGSSGTIAQTEYSDCDIWLCIDKRDFDSEGIEQLSEKVNLLKNWLDTQVKLPVYFFLSDVGDIRNCQFGQVDEESCGTAQKNILKEEFYRTMIVIAGKIPLWWVCHDTGHPGIYHEVAETLARDESESQDFIDLGDIEPISEDEYFGAALWQLNKSLTYPLKSIIKMLLLKMQIDKPPRELLCSRFRKKILEKGAAPAHADPSLYTVEAILDHNQLVTPETLEFIKQCIYLRFDLKMFTKRQGLKEKLAADLVTLHRIERNTVYRLNEFAAWSFSEQVAFGARIFHYLLDIYKAINDSPVKSSLSADDMTIIGHKIASCLVRKADKVPVIHKPISQMTLPALTFKINGKTWQIYDSANPADVIISHRDIVTCLAYLVWNGISEPGQVRMEYNPTAVTIQEIINLSKVIRETFGCHDVASIDFTNFMEPEQVIKGLVVVSFDGPPNKKNMNDLHFLYQNHWGELFVRQFSTQEELQALVTDIATRQTATPEIRYYIQRNSHYYEKNIERTKRAVLHAVKSGIVARI